MLPAMNLLGATIVDPNDLEPFNAETLTDPDGCTCVAVVGPPGSGKSELTKALIARYFPGSAIQVYDTDATPTDWQGLPVVGRKGDTTAIAMAMSTDITLLKERTELRGDGKPFGGEAIRIVEEFPTLSSDLEEPTRGNRKPYNLSTDWLKRLIRRGRKHRMKIFLVSQEFEVEALRIGGEGSLRKAFTVFWLGSAALDACRKEPDKARRSALRQWQEQQERPCIVHQGRLYPYRVPNLTGASHSFTASPSPVQPGSPERSPSVPGSPPVQPGSESRTYLERLWELEFQISGSGLEPVDSPSESPDQAADEAGSDPGSEFSEIEGIEDEVLRSLILEYRDCGVVNQDEFILHLWGITKGASRRYQRARERYQAVCKKFRLFE